MKAREKEQVTCQLSVCQGMAKQELGEIYKNISIAKSYKEYEVVARHDHSGFEIRHIKQEFNVDIKYT